MKSMAVEGIESRIREYSLGDCTLWLLSLEGLPEADFARMYACCSPERQRAADRIRSALKRRQSVGAGYLLYCLKERFFIGEEPIVLSDGKPVFPEKYGVHFNISHSGGYAVLAFGEAPLGVDIEEVKRADLKVAKRFFREEEYRYVSGREEAGQADAFCRIWTGKEAVVKASGAGLLVPLDSFSVLGEIAECSGNRYHLYQQKMTEEGKSFWVSAARLIRQQSRQDSFSSGKRRIRKDKHE